MKNPNWPLEVDWVKLGKLHARLSKRLLKHLAQVNRAYDAEYRQLETPYSGQKMRSATGGIYRSAS